MQQFSTIISLNKAVMLNATHYFGKHEKIKVIYQI